MMRWYEGMSVISNSMPRLIAQSVTSAGHSYINEVLINSIPCTFCVFEYLSLLFWFSFIFQHKFLVLYWCFHCLLFFPPLITYLYVILFLFLWHWFPILKYTEKISCYIALKTQLFPAFSLFLCLIKFAVQLNVFAAKVENNFFPLKNVMKALLLIITEHTVCYRC